MNAYLDYRGETWNLINDDLDDPELIFESAGRVCYQSWSNKAERSTDQYIGTQIVGHDHGSVLEHGVFVFMVADLPRSTQLELVRHGDGTSFSFESTRFTDAHLRFVAAPHWRDDPEELAAFNEECAWLVERYEQRRKRLTTKYATIYPDDADHTIARKRSKEGARVILSNSQGSDGQVGMNGRALRWIIGSRTDEHADLSIREFGYAVYESVRNVLTGTFADAAEVDVREGVPQITFQHRKV